MINARVEFFRNEKPNENTLKSESRLAETQCGEMLKFIHSRFLMDLDSGRNVQCMTTRMKLDLF